MAAANRGDRAARDQLFTSLYEELRRLAQRELGRDAGAAQAMSATTLVHEVYADLARREKIEFADRGRFLAYAARAMRGVIIDAARGRHALKRGAEFHITRIDTQIAEQIPDAKVLDGVSEALDELAQLEPRLAEVVDLKYFCGFAVTEIAAMSGVSERTVQREWEKAKLLLYNMLGEDRLDR